MINWLKKNKRKAILVLIILIILVFLLTNLSSSQKQNEFVLHEVSHQNLSRLLAETGTVKQGEEVWLSFGQGGRINNLSVKTGDEVDFNQTLASLEKQSLLLELNRAEESLSLAQLDYQKLLAGLTEEELNYYRVSLNNAATALDNAEAALNDAKLGKSETERQILATRSGIYEDVLNTAIQAVDTGLNSLLFITDIQSEYFTINTQDALTLAGAKARAAYSLLGAENAGYWNKRFLVQQFGGARRLVQEAQSTEEIDQALEATVQAIKDIKETLEAITIAQFTTTDLTLLFTEVTTINNVLAALTAQQQAINNHWVSSENTLNAAIRAVQAAERAVRTAEGNYQLALAQWQMYNREAREEDQALYRARIRQAEAEVQLVQHRLKEADLISPLAGTVVELNKQEGEIVQPGEPVLKIRPEASFQVEVEIYEGDIGLIEVGQLTKVELVAFPDQELIGRVVAIKPAIRLINNVVYYPVLIEFDSDISLLRSGLTADVTIVIEERERVLTVPESALIKKDNQTIVRVVKDGLIEEREVVTGLRGEGFQIEIISGLEVGEQVIIR